MGYVINSSGEKIQVNNPNGYCAENVVLINDDTVLVKKYMLNVFKKNICDDDSDTEFVAEIIFDKRPSKEQIIFHMTKNGVNRYSGYVTLEQIMVLDFKN